MNECYDCRQYHQLDAECGYCDVIEDRVRGAGVCGKWKAKAGKKTCSNCRFFRAGTDTWGRCISYSGINAGVFEHEGPCSAWEAIEEIPPEPPHQEWHVADVNLLYSELAELLGIKGRILSVEPIRDRIGAVKIRVEHPALEGYAEGSVPRCMGIDELREMIGNE